MLLLPQRLQCGQWTAWQPQAFLACTGILGTRMFYFLGRCILEHLVLEWNGWNGEHGSPMSSFRSFHSYRIGATLAFEILPGLCSTAVLPRGSLPGLLVLHRGPVSLW